VKFALEVVTQKGKSNIFKGYLASFGNFDGYWSRRIGIEAVPSPSSEWVCFCNFAIIRHVIIPCPSVGSFMYFRRQVEDPVTWPATPVHLRHE
jgi:hypothetical protein